MRVRDIRKKRLRAHAGGRAATRYGFGQHEVDAIGKRIQVFMDRGAKPQEDLVLMTRQSKTRKALAILVGDRWIPVIYHAGRQVIVTFLPPAALNDFVPPRRPTADEQKEAWLTGARIPV